MEGKKISFGFKKTKKADKLFSDNNDDKKDYIECVEEQSIKIVGGEEPTTTEPLVIPMKPNTLITSERLKEIGLKVESALEEPTIKTEGTVNVNIPDPLVQNETLDQMAVRELMQDAKKEIITENPEMTIATLTKGIAGGESESTLDDYEAVPIQEFGVAMLRGMGWTPGQSGSKHKQPELRPKGLGLGADKVVKAKPQASKDDKQEEMVILKNSYVKINCGKYSDYYGKVVSLDEENGRIMVEIPLKKETVSLSEFMMHAVTKSEYDRESKVLNAESFEEYKKKETNEKLSRKDEKDGRRKDEKENDRRNEKEKYRRDDNERDRRDEKDRDRKDDGARDRRDERDRDRRDEKERDRRDERDRDRRDDKERDRRDRRDEKEKERRSERESGKRQDEERESRVERQVDKRDQRDMEESANGKNRNRHRDSSSSEDRSKRRKKNRKRHSSSDSTSSLSEYEKKPHKHNKNKSKRRSRSRSNSRRRSTTPEAKRDIDKKRKGKKKKRDRDRSPIYKKHRK